MSAIQVLGLVATVLGIIVAVFNLVTFVREKDPGHLRAGIITVVILAVLIGVVAFPFLAPGAARRMASSLPSGLKPWLGSWLAASAPSPEPVAPSSPLPSESAAPLMQGTAQVDLRRNLVGGIDAVVAVFEFADLSNRGGRILSYEIALQSTPGGPVEAFRAVMDTPVTVAPGATAKVEVSLKGPVRETWLARRKEKMRGRGEVRWYGLDADGRKLEINAPLPD